MAVGITTNRFSEVPYLTVAEYKNAPTAVDISNLVVGGNQRAQDAELANIILRASSYLDEYLNQNLVATTIQETQRTRVTPQGWISLHPNNAPVVALTSFSFGVNPLMLNAIPDCSQTWFDGQQIIIPISSMSFSSQGPLAFSWAAPNSAQIFCNYTYIAGFVNTTCVGVPAESTVVVDSPDGILAGETYRIYDGNNTETVTVDSSYVFGSSTVPLTRPLTYAHTNVAFSNMPDAIKQATIIMTTAFIKMRGDQAMMLAMTTRPSGTVQGSDLYGKDISLALDMVDKYRRIR